MSSSPSPIPAARLDACRICGGKQLSEPVSAAEMMFGTREEFDYLSCADCGTLQIAEFPADIASYYNPASYYSFNNAVRPSGLKKLAKRLLARRIVGRPGQYPTGEGKIDDLKRACEPWIAVVPGLTLHSRILDVGCGEGARLANLAEFGFSNLTGVDPFLPEKLAENPPAGVRLQRKDIAEVTGTYDLVTMHHSLEHCDDPDRMLREAARLLAPGGGVLVRIPVLQPEIWDKYGVWWAQLDPPRHFNLFTMDGFVAFAERQGLKCTVKGCDMHGWSLPWSEAYQQGIPMYGEGGRENDLPFDAAQVAAFHRQARQLNLQGKGDTAYFLLQAKEG